jgi:predicted glycoside hydrolase/deacetylase ChbG (UPF0249 family)
MPKEVVFVADDFGMSVEVNHAIILGYTSGHLNAAALMMNQTATEEALAQARANPGLQIGWHFHLTDSTPATTDHWPWGSSPARAGLTIGLSKSARNLMRSEVARQWELFQATGLECRFINSHHHLHVHPLVFRTLLDVVGPQFKGWIRLGQPRAFSRANVLNFSLRLARIFMARQRRLSPWRSTDTLWGVDRLFKMNADEVRAAVAGLPDGFHEFMFHPRARSCPDTLCLLDSSLAS